jgi:hypothetical protein
MFTYIDYLKNILQTIYCLGYFKNVVWLKLHRLTNIENNIQKRLLLYAIFPIFVSMLFEKHIQTSHEHQSAIQKRESDTSQYILQPK